MTPDLKLARGTASQAEGPDAPDGPKLFSNTAFMRVVEENERLKEQVAELQDFQSRFALTDGGKMVREHSVLLTEIRGLRSQVDALNNYLTGAQFVTREEFEFLKSEHYGLSGRVP